MAKPGPKPKPDSKPKSHAPMPRLVSLLDRPAPRTIPAPTAPTPSEPGRRSSNGRFVIQRRPLPSMARSSAFPLDELAVGECLIVERQTKNSPNVYATAKKLGRTFKVRRIENGWGIWRTE